MKNEELTRKMRRRGVLIEAEKTTNNTKNEEQAGSASEVWRLRQFFDCSDYRIGLQLLPTSSFTHN